LLLFFKKEVLALPLTTLRSSATLVHEGLVAVADASAIDAVAARYAIAIP